MNKEEQIALELVKTYVESEKGIMHFDVQGLVEMYKSYVEQLKDLKEEENEKNKLYDAIDTYRYIVESIKIQIEKDDNNFVYKDILKNIIGGATDE